MFRTRNERKVQEAGIDPARLPPGQKMTEKWPVLHAGAVPVVDLETWRFRVEGLVEQPLVLDYDMLGSLPATDVTTDIHCVTRWSRFDARFRGVSWREIAALVTPHADAAFVIAHAGESYTTNLPVSALDDPETVIAWEADGAPLTPGHGWPLRLVVPSRYFWKSAKWLHTLELVAFDRPGFWERGGYHNDADPFAEERYAG